MLTRGTCSALAGGGHAGWGRNSQFWDGRRGTQGWSRTVVLFLAVGVQLGTVPSADLVSGLGLQPFADEQGDHQPAVQVTSTMLSSIDPLLTAFAGVAEPQEKEAKSSRYLVAKGLPTLLSKLVNKVWNLWTWRSSFPPLDHSASQSKGTYM